MTASIYMQVQRILMAFVSSLFVLIDICSIAAAASDTLSPVIQAQLAQSPRDATADLYKRFGYHSLWLVDGVLTPQALQLLQIIQNCDTEGLEPNNYLNTLNAFDNVQPASSPEDIARADINFTRGLLTFINHLCNGRFAPKTFVGAAGKTKPAEVIATLLHTDGPTEDLAPDNPAYKKLRTLLAQYRSLAQQHPNIPRISMTDTLRKGMTSNAVPLLRTILRIYGDLVEEPEGEDEMLFTDTVEAALKSFQKRHVGLFPTGEVDEETRNALNTPVNELINLAIINLERLRWYPTPSGVKSIFINIPSYEVLAFQGNECLFTIPAVVGHPSRRTPLFSARLVNIITNPPWSVPVSIMMKDKVPLIQNNPADLLNLGYTVTDLKGRRVNPYTINWKRHAAQYRMYQRPGEANSLGELRFTFAEAYIPNATSNRFDIYMHGTPEIHLFEEGCRAFSSGCIRLKYPRKMALWLLGAQSGWSNGRLAREISTGKTSTIKLQNTAAVYVTYATLWVDNNGYAHFGDDIYGLDKSLKKQMGLF